MATELLIGRDSISRGEWLNLYTERVLPLVVLLVAIFLRLHNLDTIPDGLLHDEAYNGIDALRILAGERPIFLTENNGREALFVYLQAISVAVLGQTSLALRVVSAILGIMTVAATYPLIRRMFDARVALLTSGWLAISLWQVIESRVGLRRIALPLILAVGFYCLWRGLENLRGHGRSLRSVFWFSVGGVLIGLSLYTYSTARFVPLIVVAFALYLAFLHRSLFLRALPGLTLALGLTILVFLPEGLFFLRHPEAFLERAEQVSVLTTGPHQASPGQELLDSALRSLGTFAIRGDYHWERNIPDRPIFDPLSATFMLMGLALSVRRFRQPAYGLILMWLVIMFVPTILGEDTPYHPRLAGLIPALFVLPALGTAWLWQACESRRSSVVRTLPVLLVTLAFVGGALYTYHSYFRVWASTTSATQAFGADRYASFEAAVQWARDRGPALVSVYENTFPQIGFMFASQNNAQDIRTFEYNKTVIFLPEPTRAGYLFTSGLPPSSIIDRYFDEASAETVGTLPSGGPIIVHRLLDPLPAFDPDWPVPARFGEQVFIYGVDIPKDLQAGELTGVRWYWHILTNDKREFLFTNQLLGWDGERRGHLDAPGYDPNYWPVGTTGITLFQLEIDPETTTGAYWLMVAVYDRNRRDSSTLPVFDAQGNRAGNHLRLGPIKVHGRPPALSPEGLLPSRPAPENLLSTTFADQIDLLGYSLSDHRLVPGQSLELTLFWSARGRPTQDYTVFLHLLDSQGQLRGQADSPPASGKYPSSVWDAGETIADLHTLPLTPQLPAGEYSLAIGIYNPITGQRVPIVDENGQSSEDHVVISGFVVEVE